MTQSTPARNAGWEQQQKDMATANAAASAASPTEGEPIPLNYLPFTPHLICHLRPAELWQKDPQFSGVSCVAGQLSLWMQAKIKEVTTFEPQDIEELTLALNFGPRTTEPELAAVSGCVKPMFLPSSTNTLGPTFAPIWMRMCLSVTLTAT